jgi:hypothetical protein
MGQIIVRNLYDAVIERHRTRAEARHSRAANRPPPPGHAWPTAEELVREDRDCR